MKQEIISILENNLALLRMVKYDLSKLVIIEDEEVFDINESHPISDLMKFTLRLKPDPANFEPLYLNLFEVSIDNRDDLDMFTGFIQNVNITDKLVGIEFGDAIDEKNTTIVYDKLIKMYMEQEVIKKMRIRLYDKKGDVYHERVFKNVKICELDLNLNLDYSKGTEIARHRVAFNFDKHILRTMSNSYTIYKKDKE